MEQEEAMNFQALRAKFQDEEILVKQPRIKPALPEKPKVFPPPQSPTAFPPPQSPTHHLPAGARPSLLTSISQTLEGKPHIAPRVVFKDEKKESKKPLILSSSKSKEKSEGKLKGKDKSAKGSKEKLDADLVEQKPKKESKDKRLFSGLLKESTAELVPATPPPKAKLPKKKGFLVFKKSVKKDVTQVPSDPILDSPSPDISGPVPLIPTIPVLEETTPERLALPTETQRPRALIPPIPTLPDSSAAPPITPPSPILAPVISPPEIPSPPSFIPDMPAPEVPTVEIKTPVLPVSVSPRSLTPNPVTPTPTSPVPSPAPSPTQKPIPTPPPPAAPTPSPESAVGAAAGVEVVDGAVVEKPAPSPSPPLLDPPSIPSSPKGERAISALSALERAAEMSPGKRTPPCDQRIVNALEKARRKYTSPLTSPTPSSPVTPTPEDAPPLPPFCPTPSLPELPPIDYNDQARCAVKPAQVNGFDHRQASPVLEGIAEEGADFIPELLEVPPPPPKKPLPLPESLGPAPEKPARPPTVDLTPYLPTPLEENAVEIPAPLEFSETDTSVEVPLSEDVGSDVQELQTPEMPESEWGNEEYDGTEMDPPEGETLPEAQSPQFHDNGITDLEANGDPEYGVEFQEIPQPDPATDVLDSSSPVSQDIQPITGPQVEDGTYESGENVYEDIPNSTTKKKGKGEGKKRKGPPKNPYAEAQQPTNEEKSKTGRFGRNDKKSAPEGADERELKKKEKQRLEKEKKELKEQKEREKREQKEKEKKESETKKKFKITGQEEAMYQATVTVTTKARKYDLPVKSGDVVSIIRTTSCPKGKWLARDSTDTYGYIAVDHVELDIKEMLELGKKAAITHKNSNKIVEEEATSMGSRASNQYPLSTGSFTDDSEEWTCDDDEPVSPAEAIDPEIPQGHTRSLSMPEMGDAEQSVNHQHSNSDISTETPQHSQARHEALQKLATFFHSPKPVVEDPPVSTEEEKSAVLEEEEAACLPESSSTQEVDSDVPDMLILPPPDLYADISTVK